MAVLEHVRPEQLAQLRCDNTGEFMMTCWACSGPMSNRLDSRPILVCRDITMRSRSESIGGFVTCANCCRK